jgi:transitional endoplasmic reticulum ATPase
MLASETHGYVGADLKSLCTNAGFSCARRQASGLLDTDADMVDASVYAALEVLASDFNGAMKRITPSAMRDVVVQVPDVKFADIGGLENVKQELKEMIEFPVKYAALFEDMGTVPPKGALLYGPPGCGKTMLAKAIANECSANFISIKGPELLDKYVGESERAVRQVFTRARASAPCVVFFDELDALAPARGTGADSGGVSDRVVSALLAELDTCSQQGGPLVFVLGATNRPDLLDRSLLRPGRFDRRVYIGPLTTPAAQQQVLSAQLRQIQCHAEVTPEAVQALLPPVCTGADIRCLLSS